MKQFEYEIYNRATGRVEHARATATSSNIARAQIVLVYGSQFDVAGYYADVYSAHQIVGEIDCSNFDMNDYDWLMRESCKIEDENASVAINSFSDVSAALAAEDRANRELSCDHYAGF
jgi:hypothetical protein